MVPNTTMSHQPVFELGSSSDSDQNGNTRNENTDEESTTNLTLVDVLPNVKAMLDADVKEQMGVLKDQMRSQVEELRKEMEIGLSDVEGVKKQVISLKDEMKEQLGCMKDELMTAIAAVRADAGEDQSSEDEQQEGASGWTQRIIGVFKAIFKTDVIEQPTFSAGILFDPFASAYNPSPYTCPGPPRYSVDYRWTPLLDIPHDNLFKPMSRASEADEHSERAKMYQNYVLEGNELYPPLHSMFVGYYDYSIPGPPDVEWPNEDLKPDEFQCINEGFNLRKHILDLFEESLKSALGDKCVAVNRPSIAPIEGDYQCYHLLSNLADLPGKVHADSVGEAISKSLTNCQIVQSFCAEGLGVSILLSDTWMEKSITNLVRGGIKQWAPKLLIKKAVMDFSSPDSPGAMDFLHFRAAITGDSITRILEFSDVTVMRAFHVTAYGSQGWQLIRPSEWMPMPPDSCQELLEIYTRAGVCWQEEDGTFYSIKEEALNHLTNVMKDKFLVMPSGIVKTELISLQYRLKYQKAEWIIYVSAHEDHFLQTLKVAESVRWLGSDNGYPKGSYISLPKKREAMPFNGVLKEVSRRSNNLIKFVLSSQDQNVRVQISDAVAYASLKYAILKSPSDEIDVNHLFNRKGKTAVYLLRTYSWISGMLKEDIHIEELKKNNAILIADFGAPVLIHSVGARALAVHLLRFPEVIQEAVDSLSASVLCEYLYHLAMIFTEKFYEEYARELKFATLRYREPLLQKMLSDISSRRTLLIAGCKIVMEKCLQLLGLEPVSTLLF